MKGDGAFDRASDMEMNGPLIYLSMTKGLVRQKRTKKTFGLQSTSAQFARWPARPCLYDLTPHISSQ